MKKFLGANENIDNAKIVLIGIPFDGTSSFRSGSRFAPDSIRLFSDSIETYSPYFNDDIENINFYDSGNIEVTINNFSVLNSHSQKIIKKLLEKDKKTFVLGGEHLITLPVVEIYKEFYNNLKVIQLDAHTDLRDEYFGEKYSHATVMRRIFDIVGEKNIFQFGIRSGTKDEFNFANKYTNLVKFSLKIEKFLDKLKNFPIYLTIDLDVFDLSILPGTGNPEPGGVNFKEFIDFLEKIKDLNIVGCDVVELNPEIDKTGASSILSAEVVREMLIVLNKN